MRATAILAVLLPAGALAQTDASGDQSGTWGLAGSPYRLVGDVAVPDGLSLFIEPGVEVVGMGHFSITVGAGSTLTADGTAQAPILFTSADTDVGWRGMRLVSSSDASSISHCVFEYAKAEGLPYPEVRGGALSIIGCSPTVGHSEFRFSVSRNSNRNGVGGGILTESSNAVIRSNFIHDNIADSGGGICVTEYGTPLIAGNTIVNNRGINAGGGMYLGARSSPEIHSNLIAGNFANGWGGGGINCWNSFVFYGTYPTIHHNIIVRNATPTAGGGLYCRYDRAILANNVILGNEASRGGGVFALNQGPSAPFMDNCIVWANTAGTGSQIGLEASTGSEIVVQYSNVQFGYAGAGNISGDPMFADPNGGDYRLRPGSPCIDAGNNGGVPFWVTTDYAGNDRFIDDPDTPDTGSGTAPIVDMGILEYGACPADFNGDGVVNTLDVLSFLNAWAAGDAAADFNGDGSVNTLDVLAFLNAWSGGC